MVNSPWSMVNGQWSMVHGQWSMVNGPWSMVHGVERHFATTRPGGLPFDKLRASHSTSSLRQAQGRRLDKLGQSPSIGKGTGVLENRREGIGVVGIRTESRSISGER